MPSIDCQPVRTTDATAVQSIALPGLCPLPPQSVLRVQETANRRCMASSEKRHGQF
jgi:hypothetical protein